MDERTKKSFDFAADSTKQLIALSTGILALTITFSENVIGVVASPGLAPLVWAWLLYLLSIFFGVWTLLALTGTLGRPDGEPSIYALNVRLPSLLQILSFLAATVMIVIAGINSVGLVAKQQGLCPIFPIC